MIYIKELLKGFVQKNYPSASTVFLLRPTLEFFGHLQGKHVSSATSFHATQVLAAFASELPYS
jgi:hypothetical protein